MNNTYSTCTAPGSVVVAYLVQYLHMLPVPTILYVPGTLVCSKFYLSTVEILIAFILSFPWNSCLPSVSCQLNGFLFSPSLQSVILVHSQQNVGQCVSIAPDATDCSGNKKSQQATVGIFFLAAQRQEERIPRKK